MEVNKKGITLVALVITIIVLLILVGITLTVTLGDEGILAKAQSSRVEQRYASIMDEVRIRESEIEIAFEKGEDGETRKAFVERLGNNGLIDDIEDRISQDYSIIYLGRIDRDNYKHTIEIKNATIEGHKAEQRIKELPDANAPGNEHLKNLTLIIRTTQANEKVFIPISGIKNLRVNWDAANHPNDFIIPKIEEDTKMYFADNKVPTFTYSKPNTYEVQIKGEGGPLASLGGSTVADFFYRNENLVGIKSWGEHNFTYIGSLGTYIEGEIPSPSRNSFKNISYFNAVFKECPITSIHEDLLLGLPYLKTVDKAFVKCRNLEAIPENLFSNNPFIEKFSNTFGYCNSIKTIPEKLFASCPNVDSFYATFSSCLSLETIPENLFTNCTNVERFNDTFSSCYALTSIPLKLFDNNLKVTDFTRTFNWCKNLTGMAPNIWDRKSVTGFERCFSNCNKLSNYRDIPYSWT